MKGRVYEYHYNNYETIDIEDSVGGHQKSQRLIGLATKIMINIPY